MAIPVINFSQYRTDSMVPPDFMEALQQGIKTGFTPRQMQQDLQKQQLANQLQKIALQYAPQNAQAELAYKQQQAPHLQAQTGLFNQQAQYYGPNIQSEIGLRNAQANLENQKAQLPYGGATLPGIAGEIIGLESIKKMYGENSPQYEAAKRQFDLGQQNMQARIDYQNTLSSTAPIRYLTPTGKGIVEQANVGQGNAPTGRPWEQQINSDQQQQMNPAMMGQLQNSLAQQQQIPPQGMQQQSMPQQQQINPMQMQMQQGGQQIPMQNMGMQQQQGIPQQNQLAPGNPQELSDAYGLTRLKQTTDSATRQKNLYATNVEKTIDNINVDDLTKYSGVKGATEYASEKSKDALGFPTSDDFKKFNEAMNASQFLASQARQFYGESIQPGMRKKLEDLTNPSSWMRSPETAKTLFNNTKKILGQEMQTYRDAMKSTEVYKGKGNNSTNLNNQTSNIQQTKNIGGNNYHLVNGQWMEE
jgi:hypothetical protein